jgi:hypothetical protein
MCPVYSSESIRHTNVYNDSFVLKIYEKGKQISILGISNNTQKYKCIHSSTNIQRSSIYKDLFQVHV